MKTNTELVNYLINKKILKSSNIINSFNQIDRRNFVKESDFYYAYLDRPLSIGYGQTISQPSTVAFMLELLSPNSGEFILDIGSGSGWTTAMLAYIVGEKGYVKGLERISELVIFGENNLKKYQIKNAKIILSGNNLGIKGKQFDKILVSASAEEIPIELIEQLKKGGTMVIPIINSIFTIKKGDDEKIYMAEYPNFVFVPLIYQK
ncbi:MAG: protein-L-isoaspartate O-methyltransferase [Candidatus Gracilibacteria bacterium]|nr:protein-L-isoaspartate O-methyltransferase [Candidatus Gracilibacteria bacterium]